MSNTTTATVEHVAPSAILIEDNVREAVELPREFVASIKQHGVIQPVLATRAADGTLRVRDGQRRTLAAREAGLATIPAYVTDAADTDRARIVQQIVANDQRDGLTDRDRTRGFATLALDGMSIGAIAKATGHKRATVDTSVRVAKSATAASLFEQGTISLDAAAILAAFEDDAEALADLTDHIDRGRDSDDLEWVAKRWTARREREAEEARIRAEAEATGVRILDEDDQAYISLSNLTDDAYDESAEDQRPAVDPEAHTACGGHALRFAPWKREPTPVCTTPEQHYSRYSTSTEKYAPPVTAAEAPPVDEDDETRAAREADEAEAKRAERREIREHNKAWRDAEPGRREWLARFLQRKTMPKDATAFAATILAATAPAFGHNEAGMAVELAGQDGTGYWARLTPEPGKPVHALVALSFAAVERGTDVHTWRRRGDDANVVAYLTQLATWGYPLSDVERSAAGIDVDPATE